MEQANSVIKELLNEKFEPKYFEQCGEIWQNYVPRSGKAEVLQGELLRELEMLRWEGQEKNNEDWNDEFSGFCDFLGETLCAKDFFDENEKARITAALGYLRTCGEYARKKREGAENLGAGLVAYKRDNLYDVIADAIGCFHANVKEPIPFN